MSAVADAWYDAVKQSAIIKSQMRSLIVRHRLKSLKPVGLLVAACVACFAPSQASALTKVTFSGTINSPAPAGFTANSPFSISFTFNPNYPDNGDTTTPSCGTVSQGSYYQWNDQLCTQRLFSSIEFTNSIGTYAPNNGSYTDMFAGDSAGNAAYANPVFIGTGFAASETDNSAIYYDPDNNPLTTTDRKYLNNFNIITGFDPYYFNNAYLQPYVNVGSSLPTPSYFMQFYYSSSYYRDYSIDSSATPTPIGELQFFGEDGDATLYFTLTGMDIVTPIPSPLPLLGASSALYFSRKLRKRISTGR